MSAAVLLAQVVRVPDSGIAAFQRFEATVLPLLPQYTGKLERRLRTADGRVEVHVISFDSRDDADRYLADPVRQAHLHLLAESEAVADVFEVDDVTDD